MNNQIIRDNLEQEIASLKEQRVKVANDLGGKLKEYDGYIDKIAEVEGLFNAKITECNNKVTEVQKKLYIAKDKVTAMNKQFQASKKNKEDTEKLVNDSVKKLENINFRIFNGENSLSKLEVESKSLDEGIKEKTVLDSNLVLKNEQLRGDNNRLLSNKNEIIVESGKVSRGLQKEVEQARKEIAEIELRAEKAEYKYTSYNQIYGRQVKKLSIYAKRTLMIHEKALKKLRYANRPNS